jgi:3-dehydroquinate synthase
LGRDGTIVGLGGGVVTDTAGYTAATWLRGLRYVAVPTTLLGMVDAAVGGKTGVNHPAGKNLVGAFHHPSLVVADPLALATLPSRVLTDGLAEVLKVAMVGDPTLLADLARDGAPALSDMARWSELIERSVRVKAAIVSADPDETGSRIHLNLGHTFAHALELASGYRLSHGRAVAIGLVAAARLGERLGNTEPGLAEQLIAVLRRVGLPVCYEGLPLDDVLAAMRLDKKRAGGSLRFVVPMAVGNVQVVDGVGDQLLREIVAERRVDQGG